ncbi:hypothetical protein FB45DRAFT_1091344 [Roridomyces roridus]|uniref:Uncharacterized protein n=1 Tax=Roridomyces roridus TaxID=1738132 RepID=A0AAD7BIV5_9AGAR|nr:hypothetical protein FB45DRAFT_1091344 [Roridomyces roridus]
MAHLNSNICLVGIHHAPLQVSRDEFKAGLESMLSKSLEMPVMKENTSWDAACRLDHTNKAAGVRPPHVTAVITADYETRAQLIAVREYPATKAWAESPELNDRAASLFAAERKVLINKPGIPENRVHGIAILPVPEGGSPAAFAEKAENIIRRAQELPCVQKGVLRLTLFSQDGTISNRTNTARHTFIFDAEYENSNTHKEVVDHPDFAEIHEMMKDYDTPSFFGADPTIRKI